MSASNSSMPPELVSGDTLNLLISDTRYPASDGWVLVFVFANASATFDAESTAEGSDHRLVIIGSVTGSYDLGTYSWQCFAYRFHEESATEVYTIQSGRIKIVGRLGLHDYVDTRSHAEKTLEAIESWIEGRNLAVAEYEVAGRRMKYIPIAELLKLRDQYRREVNAALGKQSGRSGRVYLRF